MNPAPAAVVVVTVHKEEPIPGLDGAVEWWDPPLSDADAVTRLQAGEAIVARGTARRANRNKAMALMVQA
jgi:hypothetical protein